MRGKIVMAKIKRCEHSGKTGRCKRPSKWAYEDDSMRMHYYCTQHLNMNTAQGVFDLKEPVERCHNTTRNLRCECNRYVCLFKRTGCDVKGPLVNKGKGMHAGK